MALGALIGYGILRKYGRKANLAAPWVTDLFIVLIVSGFIGARLYHVTNEWTFYAQHPWRILQVWNGGLAIHGAMIAGLLVAWYMSRRKQLNTWTILDLIALSIPLGQAIGRWGNFFNQELYGRPTNMAWKLLIDPPHRLPGYEQVAFYHPTFLYESIGCVVIFFMLRTVWNRRSQASSPTTRWFQPGSIALMYFILYSFLRMGVESLRIDRVPILFGLRLPLVTSAIVIILAASLWIIRSRRSHANIN